MHETLATAYELMTAEDRGDYWRIRNILDHTLDDYFTKGKNMPIPDDYTSANTAQLSQPEVERLLLTLPDIRTSLGLN